MRRDRYRTAIKQKSKGEITDEQIQHESDTEIEKLTQICRENDKLDLSLYGKYDVKRGLRDLNGKVSLQD